jgi:hypothetical protein
MELSLGDLVTLEGELVEYRKIKESTKTLYVIKIPVIRSGTNKKGEKEFYESTTFINVYKKNFKRKKTRKVKK